MTSIHTTFTRTIRCAALRSRCCGAVALAAMLAGAGLQAQSAVPSTPGQVVVYQGAATAPTVTLTITPANPTIPTGGTLQFVATVKGTRNTELEWSATGGSVSPTGLYTAGSSAGPFAVTARLRNGTITASTPLTIGPGGNYVDIAPGDDIQARVTQYPTGTAFRLKPGVHRPAATIVPKNGNSFVGDPGAVLSGARLLASFTRSGTLWVVDGQTQQGSATGVCWKDSPRCAHPEDLYINDVMLRHVSSLVQVGPGKWYFDYAADRIYFGDDPTGKRVETTVRRTAFSGNASNVTIAGLVIEKFGNAAQQGAIAGEASSGWTVRDNDIRFNHGMGLRIGHRMRVLRNKLQRNGQMGLGGVGDDVLVEGNEIAHNNAAGFDAGWEAGGTKFVKTNRLVVRNNFSHHNAGPGLWTDIDNLDTVYDGNRVEDNTGAGIFHEISYAAVIRNNTVRRNGLGYTEWVWGAGILVAASPDVEVYGNTVENNGDGIAGVQQPRGAGAHGPWETNNLWVHDNTITMTQGLTGFVQDAGDTSYFTSRNIRFEQNTYKLGPNPRYFAWANAERTEAEWRRYGHDVSGTFTR